MWAVNSREAKTRQTKLLGDFEIESGKAFVSDPCYDLDTWCAKVVENVKNGKWLAKIETMQTWGERVAKLTCYHESVSLPEIIFKEVEVDIGVDSGQAGIFDINHFKKDLDVRSLPRESKEKAVCEDEPWYSYCCDKTLSEMGAGIIPFGVVTSSGFGDGSYKLEIAKKNGEVVGMQVTFLEEEEEVGEDGE